MKVLIFVALLAASAMGKMVMPRLPLEVLMRGGWPLIDDKIVGGSQATRNQFPWQISLQRAGALGSWSHSCGGSVYTTRKIIDAAHCVSGANAANLRVVAGEYSLSANDGTEQIRSLTYTMHPSYNSATSDYDIAMLTLTQALTFGTSVSAVALPAAGSTPAAGTTCTVSGWGTTSSGGSIPDILRYVNVPIVSAATCQASYGASAITARMICAGFAAGGADSCQGDSGGPLVQQGTNTLIGVVSWGYGCAAANYYGVYTKVSQFNSWIAAN